ncbi:GNAT family N-acetyltransferase [Jeotgalibacillus sp. ET6]|uniref:GNAT family N-acetyltransferase n=1 Tax=Jeotgalibacillus sp. ET6 TaxID=3037260 RepID=UPI002418469C|nr:GNAT family N-acetyltransferase [Jeotgalibacillus sp. ET6]MDG5471718.1 GNAT family N-acetyltransferase [Jeotgalibacillus sp. ET6]
MYKTRWTTNEEIPLMADYWYRMVCEMEEVDGIPKPDLQRVEEVRNLFIKETELDNLKFRVAIDNKGEIVACAGGLIRSEYAYPLSQELSLFGWLLAVYTLKNHRRNGLAYKLVDDVCLWLTERGAKRARLWSSSSGRKIYENLGFKNMMDMSKPLI